MLFLWLLRLIRQASCLQIIYQYYFKIIDIIFRLLGGGVQLSPLGTAAATDLPIVACPG
jgi:DUF917 family protein